jgi:hypothetical protein
MPLFRGKLRDLMADSDAIACVAPIWLGPEDKLKVYEEK